MPEITGYRQLDESEILVINATKLLATTIGDYLEVLSKDPAVDQRWLSIAKTDLQKGFMALTRSIAKPTSF